MQLRQTKQVVVVRKDLKMRRGKEIAQGSHASLAFLTRRLVKEGDTFRLSLREAEERWLGESFAKVCLQIEGEQALLDLHQQALDAGLESHLIQDSGLTEFGGVPTYTCLAIGPDYVESIDPLTGHLKLY